VVPELDNVIASLELMLLRMDECKKPKIGRQQRALAEEFLEAGLLTASGFEALSGRSVEQESVEGGAPVMNWPT